MNIKDFKSLYIGGDKVKSIYIDGTLVWTSEEPIQPTMNILKMSISASVGNIIHPVYVDLTSTPSTMNILKMGVNQ